MQKKSKHFVSDAVAEKVANHALNPSRKQTLAQIAEDFYKIDFAKRRPLKICA